MGRPTHDIDAEVLARVAHDLWNRSFPKSGDGSNRDGTRDSYVSHEPANRASFLHEAGRHIPALGIENAFEPGALSIQPLHAVPEHEVVGHIAALGYGPDLAANLYASGFTLIDLSFVSDWLPESLFTDLRQELGLKLQSYLVDPYSGFLHWIDGGTHRNTPLAYASWFRHMQSLAPESAKWMRENKEDTVLSPGMLLSRLLLGTSVPAVRDSRGLEIPELTIRSDEEFSRFSDLMAASGTAQGEISPWYRGQPREYLLPNRRDIVACGIAPYSNVRDPSLIPSLYRGLRDHTQSDDRYERFCRIVAEWVMRSNTIFGPCFALERDGASLSAATCGIPTDAPCANNA